MTRARLSPAPLVASLAAAAALAAWPAWATDYYVSPTGDDGNTGLGPGDGEAWRTIARAARSASGVQAGDTVHVATGQYAETVCALRGAAGSYITFQSDPPLAAVFADHSKDCLTFDDASYVRFRGFRFGECKNHGVRFHRNSHHVEILRSELTQSGGTASISVETSSDVVVHGNTIVDAVVGIRVASSPNGVRISANRVSGSSSYAFSLTGGGGQIELFNNLAWNNQGGGVLIDGPSNVHAYNNTVVQGPGDGWCVAIGSSANGLQLKNNVLLNTGAAGAISIAAAALTLPSGFSDFNVLTDRLERGGSQVTLGTWQSFGQDVDSDVSTPDDEFVSATANDYHLASSARAIGNGTPTGAPSVDIDGIPRTGPIDIGAYAYLPVVPPDAGAPDLDAAEPDAASPGEDAAQPGEDASQPGEDASQPGEDAAQPGEDAAQPGEDAAQPGEDAAQPGEDAAQPGEDAASPGEDAGQPGTDAGPQPGEDAGPYPGEDAQAVEPDGGAPGGDGAVAAPDAEPVVPADGSVEPEDAGAVPAAPDGSSGAGSRLYDLGGCGCSSAGSLAGLALWAAALGLLGLRGRRRRS